MGEEWNAPEPFPLFCDFGEDLAETVRNGRREEFARFPEFKDPEVRSRIPDCQASKTFAAAKLDWRRLALPEHAEWLAFYRRLLEIRRKQRLPLFANISGCARYQTPENVAVVGLRVTSAGEKYGPLAVR